MAAPLTAPIAFFTDRLGGPLNSGYLYIGRVGENPQIADQQIPATWSDGTPVAQPIRTIGGVPTRAGQADTIIVSQAIYSLTALDAQKRLVFYRASYGSDAASAGYEAGGQAGAQFVSAAQAAANAAVTSAASVQAQALSIPDGLILKAGFAAIAAATTLVTIPAVAGSVETAYHTKQGSGTARYFRNDALTDAQLTQFPRSTFKAQDENGNVTRWILALNAEWRFSQFGAVPVQTENATAPDCYPAFQEMEALNKAFPISGRLATAAEQNAGAPPVVGRIAYGTAGRTVYFDGGWYDSSDSWNLHARWDFVGQAGGGEGAINTLVRFAANKHGIIGNNIYTDGETVYNASTVALEKGRADGSTIRRMGFASRGGTDFTKHGIWMRCLMTLEDVFVRDFPGNNVNIVGTFAGQTVGTNVKSGNVNDWQMVRVTVLGSGRHGFYVSGDDANAGYAQSCHVMSAGAAGIYDASFLGNRWSACAVHSCNSKKLGQVRDANGNGWFVISEENGANNGPPLYQTKAPGTDDSIWYPLGVIPANKYDVYPLYDSTATYVFSGGIGSPSNNASGTFDGLYLEVGQVGVCHVVKPSMVNGGNLQTQFSRFSSFMYVALGFRSHAGGWGNFERTTDFGAQVTTDFGTDFRWSYAANLSAGTPGTVEEGNAANGLVYRRNVMPGNQGMTVSLQNSFTMWTLHWANTIRTFGRVRSIVEVTSTGALTNHIMQYPGGLLIGDNNNARKFRWLAAAPPDGQEYAIGETYPVASPPTEKCWAYVALTRTTLNATNPKVVDVEAVRAKMGSIFFDASATYDAPNLAPGAASPVQTLTSAQVPALAFVVLGDGVMATYVGNPQGTFVRAWISAAGTLSWQVVNPADNTAAVDLASGTYRFRVTRM